MKKILFALTVFFSFQLSVLAVEDYVVEIDILEDSSVFVKEVITMDYKYYGFERNIKNENIFNNYYNNLVSLGYDYSYDIELDTIKSVDYNNQDLNELYLNGDLYEQVDSALKGDFKVFTKGDFNIKIYNSSVLNKDILISYYLEDIVIKHEDSYEFLFNIFDNLSEDIKNLNITINLNSSDLVHKVFVHNQESEILIDGNKVTIECLNIKKGTDLDFRILFDSTLKTNKVTNNDVLPIIYELENNLVNNMNIGNIAYQQLKQNVYDKVNEVTSSKNRIDYELALIELDKLNDDDPLKVELYIQLVEIESQIERKEALMSVLLSIPVLVYIIILCAYNFHYFKKDNRKPSIKKNYSLGEIYYLKYKKINNKTLIYLFLDLVEKNIITYDIKKEMYYLDLNRELTKDEEKIVKLFFENKSKITYNQLLKLTEKNHKMFIVNYSNYLNNLSHEVIKNDFFISLFTYKIFGIVYSIIGIFLYLFLKDCAILFNPLFLLYISIAYMILVVFMYKRSNNGKEALNSISEKNNSLIIQTILKNKKLTIEYLDIYKQLKNVLKRVHYKNKNN